MLTSFDGWGPEAPRTHVPDAKTFTPRRLTAWARAYPGVRDARVLEVRPGFVVVLVHPEGDFDANLMEVILDHNRPITLSCRIICTRLVPRPSLAAYAMIVGAAVLWELPQIRTRVELKLRSLFRR